MTTCIFCRNSRDKFVDQLRSQFSIEVEVSHYSLIIEYGFFSSGLENVLASVLIPQVRHLPIGDTLWIARHKVSCEEYVLDFIIERKKVNDLLSSIKDTRYKQQKLRLLVCCQVSIRLIDSYLVGKNFHSY
jgi:hypothetical protein